MICWLWVCVSLLTTNRTIRFTQCTLIACHPVYFILCDQSQILTRPETQCSIARWWAETFSSVQQINPQPSRELPEPRLAGHIVCALCTSQFEEVWEFHAWKSSLLDFLYVYLICLSLQEPCAMEMWGSPAGWWFPTCFPKVWGEICCLGSAGWEEQRGWRDPILSAAIPAVQQGHRCTWSTFHAALLGALSAVSWDRGESSQWKQPHSVLNSCQIMGWKLLKNKQFYVPTSINLNFIFCEHWCFHFS